MGIFTKNNKNCKFLAAITKERIKHNPHLKGKGFCLPKIQKNMVDFDNDYDLILCEYYPDRNDECPDKINE